MKKQLLSIFIALLLVAQPALATTTEKWTLATVPSLSLVSSSNNLHNIRIDTTNPAGTEMLIEKATEAEFSSPVIIEDWAQHTDGDTFNVTVNNGESVYLRIKARNGEGVETDYSTPLSIVQAPAMPTLSTQESTDKTITLRINPVTGATSYKVKRLDNGQVNTFTNFVFTDQTVLPGRAYTYEFWAENIYPSQHNTVTIWTKPQAPTLTENMIGTDIIILNVGLGDNPANITIEARGGNGLPVVNGTQVSESNLQPSTDYTYEVRVKSGNNEYSEWVKGTFKTAAATKPRSSITPEEQFKQKAALVANQIDYKADGELNSGRAWINVKSPATSLSVKATIEGTSKKIGTSWSKFDNLDDNTTYQMVVEITDGTYSYKKTYSITTPNRTPPIVENVYYDENGNIVLEVRSKTELDK